MEEFSLHEPAYRKLRERIDKLGLATVWPQVENRAKQSDEVCVVYLIYDTLESAWCSILNDHFEREFVEQVAGRSKDTVRDRPKQEGAAERAEQTRRQLIELIDRVEQEGLFGYDVRLRQTEGYFVPARRILKAPAEPPEIVKDARARRKQGRPRQTFHRAFVRKTLTDLLMLNPLPGETRVAAPQRGGTVNTH